MSTDVRDGQAVTFVFRPPTRWATPTGEVLDRDGTTVESPTPTVDTVSTTVASASAKDVITLASAGGVTRGTVYEVTSDLFGAAISEVGSVDGSVVTLVEPLPALPELGDTFVGIEISLAIAAIADRDVGYRAFVRQGSDERSRVFHVVHTPFVNPIEARHVRAHVSRWWPGSKILASEEDLQNIADEAGATLRRRLLAKAEYPHRFWDHEDMAEAGRAAMELELARRNYIPRNADPQEFRRGLQFDLRDRVAEIFHSATPVDRDDDNKLVDAEATGIAEGTFFR